MPDIARGASPAGGGKPAAFLSGARHVAPAGRFKNRPVYYADSWITDLTPIFAKRAGDLPAVL